MKLLVYDPGVYRYANQSSDAIGGAERQTWLLAQLLIEKGHEVVVGVATTNPSGVKPEINGVRFIGYPLRNDIVNTRLFFLQERPTWWYRRGQDYYLGPLNLIAHSLKISTVFSCAIDSDCYPKQALARRKYLWPMYAWGLRQTDRILAQHEGQMKLLADKYGTKTHLVNSIVKLEPLERRNDSAPPYVAWVGSLRLTKRPHLLLDIAHMMPDVKFKVCGNVTDYRSPPGYSQGIADKLSQVPNIEYLGQIPPEQANELIVKSRLLLSTAQVEGFANTFLQAWSSGVPVVSMGVDPGNVIVQKGLGRVTSEVEDTCTAVRELLNAPDQAEQMGLRGRQYLERNHAPSFVYNQIEKALL